jgi:hypothetical protein
MAGGVKGQRFDVTDFISEDRRYFEKIVKVYSAAVIDDDDFHLSNRELELLYCISNSIAAGRRDVLSLDVIRVHFRSFKDKKTLQVWLPKLIEKRWLVERGGSYYITGEFEKLVNTNTTTFNLNIIRKENEANR